MSTNNFYSNPDLPQQEENNPSAQQQENGDVASSDDVVTPNDSMMTDHNVPVAAPSSGVSAFTPRTNKHKVAVMTVGTKIGKAIFLKINNSGKFCLDALLT